MAYARFKAVNVDLAGECARSRQSVRKRDMRTIGREPGKVATLDEQSRLTAQSGNRIDALGHPFGAKDDSTAVRRNIRLMVICNVGCETASIGSRSVLNPDIKISIPTAIG
jgi:hypothetical protein